MSWTHNKSKYMDLFIVRAERQPEERIILRATAYCNTWPYILFDTTYDNDGRVTNRNRHSFIFPNMDVSKGDFIIIYTGKGEYDRFRNKRGTMTHVLYWGLDTTVWNHQQDSALLVKVDEHIRATV